MALFRNYYRCAACGRTWIDVWSATCDDDCSHCGARHMSPYKSEDVPSDTPEKSKTNGVASTQSRRIKVLNDNFRSTFTGGQVYLTSGVAALEACKKARVLEAVRTFTLFDEGNDPHGEHDFGSFELVGRRFFWKIDYYDRWTEFGSQDPANPDITRRVLTLMLAEDY